MKFKTGEKIFGVIVGVFFITSLTPLLRDEELIKLPIQEKEIEFTKFSFFVYISLIYIIFFGLTWIVARLIVKKGGNGEKKK